MFPWVTENSAQWKVANAAFPAAQASLADRRAAFVAQLPQATVVEMHQVPHFLFLAKPDTVEKSVRSFLMRSEPRW